MSVSVNERPDIDYGMRNKVAASILAFAASVAATEACAMSAPEQAGSRCRVIGAEKLPAAAGGADAICAAVERAVAAKAPKIRYSAEIRVVSRSGLRAKLIANGRELPEQHFAVMDRNLTDRSIERFASSIATALAEADRG